MKEMKEKHYEDVDCSECVFLVVDPGSGSMGTFEEGICFRQFPFVLKMKHIELGLGYNCKYHSKKIEDEEDIIVTKDILKDIVDKFFDKFSSFSKPNKHNLNKKQLIEELRKINKFRNMYSDDVELIDEKLIVLRDIIFNKDKDKNKGKDKDKNKGKDKDKNKGKENDEHRKNDKNKHKKIKNKIRSKHKVRTKNNRTKNNRTKNKKTNKEAK